MERGDVAKWSKAAVCKTAIRRFESGRRLVFVIGESKDNTSRRLYVGSPPQPLTRWADPPMVCFDMAEIPPAASQKL